MDVASVRGHGQTTRDAEGGARQAPHGERLGVFANSPEGNFRSHEGGAVGRAVEGQMTLSLSHTATSCPMRWPWRKGTRESRRLGTSAENCGRGDQDEGEGHEAGLA